jgi:hypothetical protein
MTTITEIQKENLPAKVGSPFRTSTRKKHRARYRASMLRLELSKDILQ